MMKAIIVPSMMVAVLLTAVGMSTMEVYAAVGPTMVSAEYLDDGMFTGTAGDGTVDTFKLTFDQDVLYASCSDSHWDTNSEFDPNCAGGFDVDGNVLWIAATVPAGQTGAGLVAPNIQYDGGGLFATDGVTDAVHNIVNFTDAAAPVLMSAEYYSSLETDTVNTATLWFSEAVTINECDETDFEIESNDFTQFEVDCTFGASAGIDGSVGISIIANDGQTGVIGIGDEPTITLADGSNITDSTGNEAVAGNPAVVFEDNAAPTLATVAYKDLDVDGKVDAVTLTFSEYVEGSNVSNFSVDDFQLDDEGDFDGLEWASSAANTASGSDVYDWTIGLEESDLVDTFDNGTAFDISMPFGATVTFVDAAGNTNDETTLSGDFELSYVTVVDGAAPVIELVQYRDASYGLDGKIDQIGIWYSEVITGSSVLSLDNFTVVNDGDFSGIAFTSSATDFATNNAGVHAISVGTATAIDTYDDSGNFAIGLQGTFSLNDATGNANTELFTVSLNNAITYEDDANPAIVSAEYADWDEDGQVDAITLGFSEEVSGVSSHLSANDFEFDEVGDFTGAAFGTDTTDLITTDVTFVEIPFGTEATVVDTHEDSGLIDIDANFTHLLVDAAGNSSLSIVDDAIVIIDDASPVIAGSTPGDGGSMSKTGNIVIEFSEVMDTTLGFDEGVEFSIVDDPGDVVATWDSSGMIVTLNPATDLDAPTTYGIALDPNEIFSAEGEALSASTIPVEWTFNTTSGSSGGGGGGGSSTVPSTTPIVDLTAPTSGTDVNVGDVVNVTWTTTGSGIDTVKLEYTTNGSTYVVIADDIDKDTGSYNWTVPSLANGEVTVKITAQDSGKGYLDTDTTTLTVVPEEIVLGDETDEAPEVVTDAVEAGWYVRSPSFSTVYYVTEDLGRKVFWNEAAYFTYADSWSEVVWISDELLATLPLEGVMLPNEGVVLVKISSASNVYATEMDAETGETVLRWITTETVATTMYGATWADYVIDLDPTVFGHYAIGDDLTFAETIDLGMMRTRMELADMAASAE